MRVTKELWVEWIYFLSIKKRWYKMCFSIIVKCFIGEILVDSFLKFFILHLAPGEWLKLTLIIECTYFCGSNYFGWMWFSISLLPKWCYPWLNISIKMFLLNIQIEVDKNTIFFLTEKQSKIKQIILVKKKKPKIYTSFFFQWKTLIQFFCINKICIL